MTSATPAVLPPLRTVALAHARAQVRDLLRTPVAVVSTTIFPALTFVFFILPQSEVTENAYASIAVFAQLGIFGVMGAFLFGYGISVAEDRANPWTTYLRTLPVGAAPTTVARFVVALVGVGLSLVPLLMCTILFTEAPSAFVDGQLAWWRLPVGLAALLVGGAPFLGMGLAIGYSMTSRAAVAVAQVCYFPIAFVGGLMIPPQNFPAWLDTLSRFTPARPARDLAVSVLTGEPMPSSTLPVLAGWTVLMVGLAQWAYRRDEGRRFR
jgi:ABC-2 type transport system permease protein